MRVSGERRTTSVERAFQLGEGVVHTELYHKHICSWRTAGFLPLTGRALQEPSLCSPGPQGSAVEAGLLVLVHRVQLAVLFGKLSTF